MSEECVEKFLKMLEQDPTFKQQLQKAQSKEEVKAIFEKHHLSFTKEEYIEVYQKHVGRELNSEELSQLAAGAKLSPAASTLMYFS